MNRAHQFAVGFAAAGMLVPVLASSQGTALGLGKNGDVELKVVASIGPATLEPGHYRFQYLEQDGRHYLVVKARREGRLDGARHGVGPGTEVARVECLLVPLGQKNRDTAMVLKTDVDGTSSITRIRIKGETVDHVVAPQPKGVQPVRPV